MGPRADRADDLLGLGGGEDEADVLRRLLDDLQQGVEALRGDHVGLVDDVDLVAVAHRLERRLLAQLAGVVDAAVGGRVDLDDVDRARPAGGQLDARVAAAARLVGRALGAVQGAREDARARGLAAAARAGEQVGVVDAVVPQRRPQRLGDVVLADHLRERVRPVAAVEREGLVHAPDPNRGPRHRDTPSGPAAGIPKVRRRTRCGVRRRGQTAGMDDSTQLAARAPHDRRGARRHGPGHLPARLGRPGRAAPGQRPRPARRRGARGADGGRTP